MADRPDPNKQPEGDAYDLDLGDELVEPVAEFSGPAADAPPRPGAGPAGPHQSGLTRTAGPHQSGLTRAAGPGQSGLTETAPPAPEFRVAKASPMDQFMVHLGRAFGRGAPDDELLPAEQRVLEHASPPIEGLYQDLVLWRRSQLFVGGLLAAVALLLQLGASLALLGDLGTLTLVNLLHVAAMGGALFALFKANQEWDYVVAQGKLLRRLWLLWLLLPLGLALIPWSALSPSHEMDTLGVAPGSTLWWLLLATPGLLGAGAGVLRAGIALKMLAPGAPEAGWLLRLVAPAYAALLSVVLLMLYQLTGQVLFVLALAALLTPALWTWRLSRKLMERQEKRVVRPLLDNRKDIMLGMQIVGMLFLLIAAIVLFRGAEVLFAISMLFVAGTHALVASVVVAELGFSGLTEHGLQERSPASPKLRDANIEALVGLRAALDSEMSRTYTARGGRK